ncbi:MAG: hypothetical protein M3Z21_16795 [Pseudomonadota bacterium]|nr:hypothetical protein [Pseudomonadota bacterium]
MTIVVGIFDNPQNLDEAIVQLADKGFEDTVYDEFIVAQEMGVQRPAASDKHAIVEAFKRHLRDYNVPAEVIGNYATSFFHDGKVVLVKANGQNADEAVAILRRCKATRVDRHG